MPETFIAPAGFVGEEGVTLPRPEPLPAIEEAPTQSWGKASALAIGWVMASQTTGTLLPPARRA